MKVLKTYKMFINGEFQRSESGATVPYFDKEGNEIARVCQASRKDLRNTIVAAKTGFQNWSKRTAYNRSQILYRAAEMLEARKNEWIQYLTVYLDRTQESTEKEIATAIDTIVFYAGFCDKFQQLLSTSNPINGPFHNKSTVEPMGVTFLFDREKFSLPHLLDDLCSALVGGNSVTCLVSKEFPLVASLLGEIFATSDFPKGSVNLLAGDQNSLVKIIGEHREINSINFQSKDKKLYSELKKYSVSNLKRILPHVERSRSLKKIQETVELKTSWQPNLH